MSIVGRSGVLGLWLFAVFSTWRTAPAYIGLALCIPSMLVMAWQQRGKQLDSATLLCIALVLWLSGRYALQQWMEIGTPGLLDSAGDFRSWVLILLFAPLATLCRRPAAHHVRNLWILSMAGFSIGTLGYLYENGLDILWSGHRLGFHLNRPLGAGLYAGCFALALALTVGQWWGSMRCGNMTIARRIIGIGLIALFVTVVIAAQNRSTYLAAVVVALSSAAILFARLIRSRQGMKGKVTVAATVASIALLSIVAASNLDLFRERSAIDQDAVAATIRKGLDEAPITAATIRLRLWQFSIENLNNAPLIGHGFGDLSEVIDQRLRPQGGLSDVERYDHLHNGYLQTIWSQGLVGLLLWTALIAVLVRDALRAAKQQPERAALVPAMWTILAFTAIWAFFDFRLSHPDMRFFTILMLLSLRLLGRTDDASRTVSAESRHP